MLNRAIWDWSAERRSGGAIVALEETLAANVEHLCEVPPLALEWIEEIGKDFLQPAEPRRQHARGDGGETPGAEHAKKPEAEAHDKRRKEQSSRSEPKRSKILLASLVVLD